MLVCVGVSVASMAPIAVLRCTHQSCGVSCWWMVDGGWALVAVGRYVGECLGGCGCGYVWGGEGVASMAPIARGALHMSILWCVVWMGGWALVGVDTFLGGCLGGFECGYVCGCGCGFRGYYDKWLAAYGYIL